MKDDNGIILDISRAGRLTLIFPNGSRRSIGAIKRDNNKSIYTKSVTTKHIFKKTNAWGINWVILNQLGAGGEVVLRCSNGITYSITAQKAKEHGSFLHFKNKGFELQYFIPLEFWDTVVRKKKE